MSYFDSSQLNMRFMSAGTPMFCTAPPLQVGAGWNTQVDSVPMFNYARAIPSVQTGLSWNAGMDSFSALNYGKTSSPLQRFTCQSSGTSNFFSNITSRIQWQPFSWFHSSGSVSGKSPLLSITQTNRKVAAKTTKTTKTGNASKLKVGDSWHGHRITSLFGKRKAPKAGASTNHKGIDLKYNMNENIQSFSEGKVVNVVTNSKGYGKYVDIQSSDGKVHRYAHCNKILVKKGDKVNTNTVIAKAGSTGISTGSHLHYEVMENGVKLNPLGVA